MPVSEKTKRVVWANSAGCCAICREHLVDSNAGGGTSHLLGEVAHIVAERADGPRGDSDLTDLERNHESNLLLLCLDHHKVIDDDPTTHTVHSLHTLRKKHEIWVAERLKREQPWRTKLHNFYYINVPRLNMLAATAGYSLNLSEYQETVALHRLAYELNRLMLGFQNLLQQVELKAVPLVDAVRLGHLARGMLVSFDAEFRTKNIDMPETDEGYRRAVRGNLKTDPHIYCKIDTVKVALTVDPRWITTTTAFVQFRPSGGKGIFAGLGVLNDVDLSAQLATVTPFVIGLPSNPFTEVFHGTASQND